MPSKVPEGRTRGWIIPIGGAENKENDRHVLERFVRVSGGDAADIVVIPTASRMHEVILATVEANRQRKQPGRERVLTAGGELVSGDTWRMRPVPSSGD